MYKFILDRVYPSAPKPATSTETVKTAIIEALIGHLYRLGHSVREVRVPASLVTGEPLLFVSSWGRFEVTSGLDAYGDNVVTSALAGSNATNGNTASASVAADTVTTLSGDDLVKLIVETIDSTISLRSVRTKWFAGPEDEGLKTIATAILNKLRGAGAIR